MKLFNRAPDRPLKLSVRNDRIRDLKRGYPWVFPHSLITPPEAPPGSFAVLRDKDNNIFAAGMYDPECPIAFRVCALEETLDDRLIEARLSAAIARRSPLRTSTTNCVRLINGEGDGIPGLICDLFGECAVIQLDGAGPTSFWNIEAIAHRIADDCGAHAVFVKPRSGDSLPPRALVGSIPEQLIRVLEHGALFDVDTVNGQKSGFFLDQRENRLLIRSLSQGKSVLNLFGYTGGFSIAAGLGGARSVVTVDVAKPAIAAAEHNWRINNLPSTAHHGVTRDAFEYLVDTAASGVRYDIVIVDPPSFARSSAALEKAHQAYVSLFARAASIVAPGGILALASCSSHVGSELFLEICLESVAKAKLRARTLGVHGQPLDHPFPLACRELQYLKFILLELF